MLWCCASRQCLTSAVSKQIFTASVSVISALAWKIAVLVLALPKDRDQDLQGNMQDRAH